MWCSTYLPVGEDNRIHPGVEKYISLLVLNPVISEDSALRIQKIPSIYLHKLGPLKKGESLYSPVRSIKVLQEIIVNKPFFLVVLFVSSTCLSSDAL